jgi:hypothetical protein
MEMNLKELPIPLNFEWIQVWIPIVQSENKADGNQGLSIVLNMIHE